MTGPLPDARGYHEIGDDLGLNVTDDGSLCAPWTDWADVELEIEFAAFLAKHNAFAVFLAARGDEFPI